MAQHSRASQTTPDTQDDGDEGNVAPLDRGGSPAGTRPIPGMKTGWYYRHADRMILHRAGKGPALPIGTVPKVTGKVVHLTDDGQDIRIEYQVVGKRQRRKRILTEDDLDRGTWAAKLGQRRPTSTDAKYAFAFIIRELGEEAPEVPARSYYNDDGDLIFPDAEAQTFGYRTLRGEEKEAQDAWEEIGGWASSDPKAALGLGACFVGPVLDSLDCLAHVLNVNGPGQRGKSTLLTSSAALFGDIKPRGQQLMMAWNSSKQGIPQSLRQRGFLPVALDEHSSSGRTAQDSSKEISQIVAGCIRAMGGADGSPRESDGFWHSVVLSSSNAPLKYAGQTEDLATRLQEMTAPFFPNQMLDPDGNPASEGDKNAEHVAKRVKRLARQYGGWPLEWAIRKGMFRAANLTELQRYHLELCAKHRPAGGGIPATIAELHMAWVLGAHMLGQAIGTPEMGYAAEAHAAERLAGAIVEAEETNVSDGERLWQGLDALRLDRAAFPTMEELPARADGVGGANAPRGFIRDVQDPQRGEYAEWWVLDPVLKKAAAEAGVDNVTAALHQLCDAGVHLRPMKDGKPTKDAQRLLPRAVRGAGLGVRMHCFNVTLAAELFGGDDEDEFPRRNDVERPPERGGVVPENHSLNSSGTTGTTGTTPAPQFLFNDETQEPGPDASGSVLEAAPAPAEEVAGTRYPEPELHVTDQAWAGLVAKASGTTASALRIGVLGVDGLHLPNCRPVAVPLPGDVDQAHELMRAYKLRTLYIHEDALAPLGLPSYEERADQQREIHRLYGGAQAPSPTPWAPAGSVVQYPEGGGVSAWMTLKPEGGTPVSLAIPAYEDRMDRKGGAGRGGWGGAETPAVLLDALMVYLLSTVHGPAARPRVLPYYLNPNRTAEDYAGGRRRTEVKCEAVRTRQVPVVGTPSMVPPTWHRDPGEITETESGAAWLHQFDKSAAYLPAFNSVLGMKEPEHAPEGRHFDAGLAGWWRVSEIPGYGDPRLPRFNLNEDQKGGYWISTPDVELLCEVYDGWTPDVLEAWYWPTSNRPLEGTYERLKDSRRYLLREIERGRPGARWAKQVNAKLYQSFRGYLGRHWDHVQKDHADAEKIYEHDVFWRPDWAKLILCYAMANTYRNLRKYATRDGRFALSLATDAAVFTSDSPDPEQAKPASMTLGTLGGQWSPEGSVPLSATALGMLQNGQHAGHVIDALAEEGN